MNQRYKQNRCIFPLFLLILVACSFFAGETTHAQIKNDNAKYYGKLEPDLVVDKQNLYNAIFNFSDDFSKYKFARSLQTGVTLSKGQIRDPRIDNGKLETLLIEPKENASPYVCSDVDANGIIAENECATLIAVTKNPDDFIGVINLPLTNSFFKKFPIFVCYRKNFKNQKLKPNDKLILQSFYAFAFGFVDIKGRNTRVEYRFNPLVPVISTTEGWFGIDVDGNGQIKNEPFSPETSYAYKEEIIFKLNNEYVSTERVDLTENQIVMRPRRAEEYRRQDLQIGAPMPDFSFVDFNDKKRSLAEFRGKYLLVDIWGLWCVDCRRELPFQLAADNRFKSRGFEILALNTDEEIEPVKEFLTKNKITWTQAKPDSIKNLIEVTYRIQEYPTAILLAPDGKVLILDQKKLIGEELLKTLDQTLPQ